MYTGMNVDYLIGVFQSQAVQDAVKNFLQRRFGIFSSMFRK